MRTLRGAKGNISCSISKDDSGHIIVVKENASSFLGTKVVIKATLTLLPNGDIRFDKFAATNGKISLPVH